MLDGIIEKDIKPKFEKKLLSEISPDLLRTYCNKIKEINAPANAIKVRDIISMVFIFAKARGISSDNPADYVPASTIAKFSQRDRALSKKEIGIFFNVLKNAKTSHQLKVALKLLMLTMVRINCLVGAKWEEIDFKTAEWLIPPVERMKASRKGAGRPHIVYLSTQALELFNQLHLLAGGSEYVLPSFGQSEYRTTTPIHRSLILFLLSAEL